MNTQVGNTRLYETLCKVLDALRAEAPVSDPTYNPPPGNADALIQARSRALRHLFLKARFGLVRFADREQFVTDGTCEREATNEPSIQVSSDSVHRSSFRRGGTSSRSETRSDD